MEKSGELSSIGLHNSYDILLLLRHALSKNKYIQKNDPEAHENTMKLLSSAISTLESITEGQSLDESGQEWINSAVEQGKLLTKVDPTRLIEPYVTAGQIPPALYNEDLQGAIPLEKVSQVPNFQIRGKNYLVDGKKVTSQPPLFFLRGMQVVKRPELQSHVALEPWCGYPKFDHGNEWLVLNYMIPGGSAVHVVALFSAAPDTLKVLRSEDTIEGKDPVDFAPWARPLKRFWTADTTFCNDRFKLIPMIVDGSWAIKYAVGQKPALTGKKVQQYYFRGKGYFEIDIDLSSSAIATRILSMVRGVSKSMVVDLGIAIQGESEEELPEAVLCQTRFDRVDLEGALNV